MHNTLVVELEIVNVMAFNVIEFTNSLHPRPTEAIGFKNILKKLFKLF